MKTTTNIKGVLTLVFLMSAFSLFAQRQYTVTGRVVDADSGQPLVGVAVLDSGGGGVMTDADGSYTDRKSVV